MILYTLFNKEGTLFENVTNDMNTTEEWSKSGLLFTSEGLANDVREHYENYDIFLIVTPVITL